MTVFVRQLVARAAGRAECSCELLPVNADFRQASLADATWRRTGRWRMLFAVLQMVRCPISLLWPCAVATFADFTRCLKFEEESQHTQHKRAVAVGVGCSVEELSCSKTTYDTVGRHRRSVTTC